MAAILVPVDGSVHALKAIRIACDMAEKYGGRVVLLHVLSRDRDAGKFLDLPAAKNFPAELRAALQKTGAVAKKGETRLPDNTLRAIGGSILKEAEGRVRRRGQEAEKLPLGDGDPARAIVEAASRVGASMIVMGCRGVTDAGGSAFGSISQKVFQQAECTCISVK